MKVMKVLVFSVLLMLSSCKNSSDQLPTLNNPASDQDSITHVIADFSFIDQDSVVVTNATFADKIYVTDFIFLSCPTVCPKMNATMLDLYHEFETQPDILFLSHTVDPENDSIAHLKAFATNLGVSSKKWHFVVGEKTNIYQLAKESYFVKTIDDSLSPGGIAHSAAMLLIDKNRKIRGVYDGTNTLEKERLVSDIKKLLSEYD